MATESPLDRAQRLGEAQVTARLEVARRGAARKRAERAAKHGRVIFLRIARGLYINHPLGFTISRDPPRLRDDGPRWTARWSGLSVCGILTSPATEEQHCSSLAEAKGWCQQFAKKLTR